jgi:tRNA-uridine 2-sulfurtransferase
MNNIWPRKENISITNKKVFVGLSGVVDSAVSAALLKKNGYEVTGVFIKIQISGYPCPAAQDRIEAMRVAAHLDIPFVEIDLSKEYEERVFDHSLAEFARGRTPNPDTLCNREIKFGVFYDFAMSHGADFVATGHYARIATAPLPLVRSGPLGQVLHSLQEAQLLTGRDKNKDQSYFLWMVPKEHLAHTIFPIGDLEKPMVRKLARRFRLPNSARPDSQGLCFLGDISLNDMLTRETHPKKGSVLSEEGAVIGTHDGAVLYTLGQRHGFEVVGEGNHAKPYFVIEKDIEKNTITVSHERFPKDARETRLTLAETNWIGEAPAGTYMARYRYRQKLIPATLTLEPGHAAVILHEPHYVPEGQSLVLYAGDRALGGGIIDTATLNT